MAVFCHLVLSRFFDFKFLLAAILEEFNDGDVGPLRISHHMLGRMTSDCCKKRYTHNRGTLKIGHRTLDAAAELVGTVQRQVPKM